jgi:ABC-type Zn uptake system ZnuABC Zn-binding protein ZnuA
MKQQSVKILLVEPYFELKAPNAIARESGARVVVLSPSVGGAREATDYIRLFDHNLNLLLATISQAGAAARRVDESQAR